MPSRRPDHRRILWLAEEDIAAARRLLLLLSESPGSAEGHKAHSGKSTDAKSRSRRVALERARLSHSLRQRRIEILGKSFLAEPPFDILLALYAYEDREPNVTATRVTQLAWLTPTTALRWLDHLVSEGWVTRTAVAADRRKAQLKLTDKARKALDELFSWPGWTTLSA